MILELTGSRLLAPYLGTSLFIWTSIIGIILGSLSLGYYLGGKIADSEASLGDKKASFKQFSMIIFCAAVLVAIIALTQNDLLKFISEKITDIRIGGIIASILLFAPASIFLGMVSPYAVKLRLVSLENSGSTIGRLYAISTIGSIFGTFLAGFYLISAFGSVKLIYLLAATLLLVSILAYDRSFVKIKLLVFALLILQTITIYFQNNSAKAQLIDLDTDYSRVWIYDTINSTTGKNTKILNLGRASHSAIFTEPSEQQSLVFEYTKYYDLGAHFAPDFKDGLIIGGGAYTYPMHYINKFPEANIDVVEIDPKLTELAKKHFNLAENPRLKIYHEDGRTFLNKNTKKYDLVFGDAFRSFYSIPYHLTTVESVQKIHDSLTDDGVAIINVISAIDGDKGKFLRAEYSTFKKVFPQVYLFPTVDINDGEIAQNIMLVALKSDLEPSFKNDDANLQFFLDHLYQKPIADDMPILTDDFAPVDQYIMELL